MISIKSIKNELVVLTMALEYGDEGSTRPVELSWRTQPGVYENQPDLASRHIEVRRALEDLAASDLDKLLDVSGATKEQKAQIKHSISPGTLLSGDRDSHGQTLWKRG